MPGLASVTDQKLMTASLAVGDFILGVDADDPTQSIPNGTMVRIPIANLAAQMQPITTPNATMSDPLTPMTWSHVATDGLQAVLGSGTPSSFGTMQGTGNWRAAFNAQQATSATDAWTQPNAGEPSALLTLGTDGSGDILALYYAAAGKANGNKATFWGSPLLTIDHLGTLTAANLSVGSITGVGALSAGSIVPGFGSINIGTQALTAGVTTLGSSDGIAKITSTPITLATNTSQPVITGAGATTNGILLIAKSTNSSTGGVYWVLHGVIVGPVFSNTDYTSTLGSASSTNVAGSGGNVVLENKTGVNVTYSVTFIGSL